MQLTSETYEFLCNHFGEKSRKYYEELIETLKQNGEYLTIKDIKTRGYFIVLHHTTTDLMFELFATIFYFQKNEKKKRIAQESLEKSEREKHFLNNKIMIPTNLVLSQT